MSARRLLVLDRGGARWGVPHDAVRSVARREGGLVVSAGAASLAADRVVAAAAALAVRPPGPVIGRYWPERCAGVAVHEGVPVVVVSLAEPPSALRGDRREISDATEE